MKTSIYPEMKPRVKTKCCCTSLSSPSSPSCCSSSAWLRGSAGKSEPDTPVLFTVFTSGPHTQFTHTHTRPLPSFLPPDSRPTSCQTSHIPRPLSSICRNLTRFGFWLSFFSPGKSCTCCCKQIYDRENVCSKHFHKHSLVPFEMEFELN